MSGLFKNYCPSYLIIRKQDKEIISFLEKNSPNPRKSRYIKYTISKLHNMFLTSTRSALIRALRAHELDRYFPISLFPPGIYDFE